MHDATAGVFRCRLCIAAKANNIFVTGKDSSKPKKDDLTKHQQSLDHRRAVVLPKQRKDFVTASVTANDHAKSGIIAQLRTVLTQAKHCLPTVKNAALVELQVLNVSMNNNNNNNYAELHLNIYGLGYFVRIFV